ncbi:MAG: hypothetical protein ABFS21_02355 [Actinomycetota bacterium]
MTAGEWYLVIIPIVIGLGMLGFWGFSIAGRQVPEIAEGGIEIRFHIVAEALTGLVLIAGGVAVFVDATAPWAVALSAIGLGMLMYTLIVSPGYYVERRNTPFVVMFAGIWLLAVPAVVLRFIVL